LEKVAFEPVNPRNRLNFHQPGGRRLHLGAQKRPDDRARIRIALNNLDMGNAAIARADRERGPVRVALKARLGNKIDDELKPRAGDMLDLDDTDAAYLNQSAQVFRSTYGKPLITFFKDNPVIGDKKSR